MRFASLAGSLMVLLSSAALAANGDHLVVTGDGVNVRARPATSAAVLLQVHRNDPAVELGRNGDWVEVRLPERHTEGWIHRSLLRAADGASRPAEAPPTGAEVAGPEPAAGPPSAASKAAGPQLAAVDRGDAVARFRDSVSYLNSRAVAAAGVGLFTGVKEAGDGVVQVTATDAWNDVPEAGQDSFMRILLNRWSAAAGGTQPVRVEIVDKAGHLLKEKSGP